MPHTPPLLVVDGVWREFAAGDDTVAILKDIHLTIEAGEMVAIVGASGSGKSTLMNILGCLDRPSRGRYCVKGQETRRLSPDELATLRRETFGFIFQRYHLLSDLDALGNAEIPAIYAGLRPDSRRERASRLLARLGLSNRLHHRPGQLSGGQQQRVSIARALVNGGEVILADEPTGALDSHSGQEVMAILHELHAEGHTVIMVTHDAGLAEPRADVVELAVELGDRPTQALGRRARLRHMPRTPVAAAQHVLAQGHDEQLLVGGELHPSDGDRAVDGGHGLDRLVARIVEKHLELVREIGRASCRERVSSPV